MLEKVRVRKKTNDDCTYVSIFSCWKNYGPAKKPTMIVRTYKFIKDDCSNELVCSYLKNCVHAKKTKDDYVRTYLFMLEKVRVRKKTNDDCTFLLRKLRTRKKTQ